MQAFGEQMISYRPPIHTRSIELLKGVKSNGNKELVLNFLTPHQKWGIHSTYSDNLLMLTLSRGGPIIWLNEEDAGGRHRGQRLDRRVQRQRRHRLPRGG